MIGGTTKSGFEFEANDKMLKDWDYVEALDKMRTKPKETTLDEVKRVITSLISDKGFTALKDHVRKLNEGIADVTAIASEFNEIVEMCKGKN